MRSTYAVCLVARDGYIRRYGGFSSLYLVHFFVLFFCSCLLNNSFILVFSIERCLAINIRHISKIDFRLLFYLMRRIWWLWWLRRGAWSMHRTLSCDMMLRRRWMWWMRCMSMCSLCSRPRRRWPRSWLICWILWMKSELVSAIHSRRHDSSESRLKKYKKNSEKNASIYLMRCRISGPMICSSSDAAGRSLIPLWVGWILHCTCRTQLRRCILLRRWRRIRTHCWVNTCRILYGSDFGMGKMKWQRVLNFFGVLIAQLIS